MMSTTTSTTTANNNANLLQYPFTFWYMRRGKGVTKQSNTNTNNTTSTTKEEDNTTTTSTESPTEDQTSSTKPSTTTTSTTSSSSSNPYESSIKEIITVHSVEEFWSAYSFLIRPNDLPTTTDYHFFRKGIKPTWEDPSNAKGGKWIVRLKKGLASRYWEEIILALIGCQLTAAQGISSEEVCGVVVSIRYSEDIVSVWNKTANDREVTERLRDAIKRVLQLPSFVHMEYKPHEASLQDKSSFRNTMVWKPKSGGGQSSAHGDGKVTRRAGSSSWGADREENRGKKGGGIERSWR
jgi:Translation initiation factor 4E (eIF-4E)